MHWYSHAENPRYITSLFTDLPSLEEINLIALELEHNGPRGQLRFEVDKFPKNPPTRWHKDYNQAQITVDFFGIETINIDKWGRNNSARLTITPTTATVSASAQGQECSIRLTCISFRIASVSGYISSHPFVSKL